VALQKVRDRQALRLLEEVKTLRRSPMDRASFELTPSRQILRTLIAVSRGKIKGGTSSSAFLSFAEVENSGERICRL
jgi:hypothetical protein